MDDTLQETLYLPPLKTQTSQQVRTNQNVEWNEKLEIAVKDIGEDSKSYKLMHIKEAQKANKIYNMLMIMGIIMGPLSGVTSGIGAAINSGTDPTIPIIAIILGFLAGIIVAIIKFGKYDEASNANKQAAARYTSIESNVRRQLGLYRSDRIPATPYMEWLETKYEELFLSAPLLPPDVYENYSHVAKKIGLRVPTQYEAVITINTDYEQTRVENIVNTTDIEINGEKNPDIKEEMDDKSLHCDIEMGKLPCKLSDPDIKGDKKLIRTSTMSQFPQLNHCSDKMLEYEMKRMMGFSE